MQCFKHIQGYSFYHNGQQINASVLSSPTQFGNILRPLILNEQTDNKIRHCDEIWIKPNITSQEPPQNGRTTQPIILDILIHTLKELVGTSKRIVVADSSVIGCDTLDAAQTTGILPVCHEHNVPFVDLRERDSVYIKVEHSSVFSEIPISKPFTQSNVFKINLGKVKSTYGSPVAFCTKNAKGVIPDNIKMQFHLKGLQRCLCDLGQVINWDLGILEGCPASELGQPVANGLIVASTDPILTDLVACFLVGINAEDAYHIDWLAKLKGWDINTLIEVSALGQMSGVCPALQFSKSGIVELEKKYGIDILDGKPCSGCLESFAKALHKISEKNSVSSLSPTAILGCDFNICAGIIRPTVLVGKCSFDGIGMSLVKHGYSKGLLDLWDSSKKVDGCPPTIDSIVAGLLRV